MSGSKTGTFRDLLLLNLGILCISTSGILGRTIPITPFEIIFWRSLIAFFCLAILVVVQKKNIFFLFQKAPLALLASGLLLGVHWITYFFALQWSSVAIGMLSLYTFPIITAFLEPLFGSDRFERKHIYLGLAMLLGIYLISPKIDQTNQQFLAVGMGIFSAFCFSFRNLLIKKITKNTDGQSIMTLQVGIVSLFLLPVSFHDAISVLEENFSQLFFLALVTTVIGHSLFLQSFQKFSITTASLISCLQPLYGIVMGAMLLNEIPSFKTAIGGLIILTAVGMEIYSVQKK